MEIQCGEHACSYKLDGVCALASNIREQRDAAMRGIGENPDSRPRRQGHYTHARSEAAAARKDCKDPGQIERALIDNPETLP